MSLRDAMRKAAGLLVEMPADDAPAEYNATTDLDELLASTANAKTVEQIVRDADGPNLDEIGVVGQEGGLSAELPPVPAAGVGEHEAGGEVTPALIYQMANLPASPFTAEQMLEMLGSLPQELPLDTKRQTVKVTLGALGKSMGATPETVVADASRKMAALTAYVENLSNQTAATAAAADQEVAALQAQIEEKRKAMQVARHKLATVTQLCEAESDKLDDVLEFFSLDVAPSKYAAPDAAPSQ